MTIGCGGFIRSVCTAKQALNLLAAFRIDLVAWTHMHALRIMMYISVADSCGRLVFRAPHCTCTACDTITVRTSERVAVYCIFAGQAGMQPLVTERREGLRMGKAHAGH